MKPRAAACGLASVIRTGYPRWILWLAASPVIVADVFNIGADLGGMADATQRMTGSPLSIGHRSLRR
jgi:Mn2+/Fe2+ NRAMP family transporter